MKPTRLFVVFALVTTAVIVGGGSAAGADDPPPNDRFGDAITVPNTSCTQEDLSITCSGTNLGAMRQPGEPDHAAAQGSWSVWYRWTPSFTGTAGVSVSWADQYLSQVVAVYRGGRLTALAEVSSANNNYANSTGDYQYSAAFFPVTAGITYRIAVDGGTVWYGELQYPFGVGPFEFSIVGYPYRWTEEVVDGAGGTGRVSGEIGRYPCMVREGARLHAFSYDVPGGDLRHAAFNGAAWSYEVLDGAGGTRGRIDADVGRDCSAIVAGTTLHVFYYATTGGDLRHAWRPSGSSWSFETLDGAGGTQGRRSANVGLWSSVAVFNGKLQVSYWDVTGSDVRRAWRTATGWRFQTVDGASTVGGRIQGKIGYNTSAIVYGKKLHLFYFWLAPRGTYSGDGSCQLRHATFAASTWSFETMTPEGQLPCYQGQGLATAMVSPTGVSVVYHEMTDPSCGYEALSEFRWDGTMWTYDMIDCGDGYWNGLYEPTYHSAVVFDGALHVFYAGERAYLCQESCGSGFDLHHAWRSPSGEWRTWNFAPGINEGSPWASLVYGGKIRVLVGRGGDGDIGDGFDLLMASGTPSG